MSWGILHKQLNVIIFVIILFFIKNVKIAQDFVPSQ